MIFVTNCDDWPVFSHSYAVTAVTAVFDGEELQLVMWAT